MQVPFLNLQKNTQEIKEEVNSVFQNLLEKCDFILGDSVSVFEKNFAQYLGLKHFIGCANGTDALELAVKSLDLKPTDEIIVQGNTYIATCLGVVNNNIKMKLCDVEKDSYMMDLNELEKQITPDTKAIIVVHLYGFMPDMDRLMDLCEKHNLYLIEDCAQAHGATWNGKKAGTFGVLSCFSFYPGKNLGAMGDAGGVATSSDEFSKKIRKLLNYGSEKKYFHDIIGRNSRLDTLQAGILNIKLKYLKDWNSKRRTNAELYRKYLSGINAVSLPQIHPLCEPVYHLFVIQTELRDQLQSYLKEKGVTSLVHYPVSMSETKAFEELNLNRTPNCEFLSKRILSLPFHPDLEESEIKYVCECIVKFFSFEPFVVDSKPGVLYFLNGINFPCKRIFYLDSFDTINSSFKKRGFHANMNCDEFLCVIKGEIEVKLISQKNEETLFSLNKNQTLLLPQKHWIEYTIRDPSSIILVLASETLSDTISIFDFKNFLNNK